MQQKRQEKAKKQSRSGIGILLGASFCLVIFLLFLLALTPPSALISREGKEQGFVSLNTEEVFSLEEGEALQIYPYNADHVLKLSNELLSYLSFKGEEEFSVPVNCQNPFLSREGEYILIADEGGFNYYLADAEGLVFEGKTDAPIRGASVSASGKMAFLCDEMHSKGVLRVIGEDGKHILDWRVRDRLRSGYILDMDFTPDSRYIDVTQLNSDGASLQTIMTRLDLDNARISLSLNQPDSGVYPRIYSRDGRTVYLMNANDVLRNYGAEVSRWLHFDKISEACPCADGMALLAADEQNGHLKLFYYAYSEAGNLMYGETAPGSEVGRAPYALTAGFGKIAAADGEGVYIMKENNIYDANYFACGSPVVRQQFLSENHLLLICRDSVSVIRV